LKPIPSGIRGGFTLIELLVAAAILALLVVLMMQMIGGVSSGTARSNKHISADEEARTAFDRMEGDFSGMVTRPDINPLWQPTNGNDTFYFYSQAPASFTNPTTNSQIALVGYCVTTNGLQRLSQGMGWDKPAFTNGAVTTNSTNANPTNYSTIAPSVFRMEFALLMKPGSTNNTNGLGPVTSTTPTTNGTNTFFQTNNNGQAMKDVAGIVVALGILDQASQKIINTTNTVYKWTTDTNDFPDATTNGIPVGTWLSNSLSSSLLGTPPKAAQEQIRVYERYFPLNR
jgi:prepilin-type N-terminal cleavage/methylation domain-containing protein